MAVKHVVIPLYSDKDYQYSISLQGQSFQLRFTYNETMKLYTMQIIDVDGNKLLSGVGVVPNYPIAVDYVIPNLTGAFYLAPVSDVNFEAYKLYPEDIHKYYEMTYLYDDTTE